MYKVFYDGRLSGEYRLLKTAKCEAAFWADSIPAFQISIIKGNVKYVSFDDGKSWTKYTEI